MPRNRSATTAPSHVPETIRCATSRGLRRRSLSGRVLVVVGAPPERRSAASVLSIASAGDVAAAEREKAGGDRKGGVDGGEEERPLVGEVAGAAGGEGFELESWKPALGGLPALGRDVLERAGPGDADADGDRHRPKQQRQGHAVERPPQ